MKNNQDLLVLIKKSMSSFSKSQKRIAEYILDHYEKAAYITAARLGEIVGVSESTVVRFANEIDFDGYPSFQKALQEIVKNKLTAGQRLSVSTTRIKEENVLKSVLQTDIEKLKRTLDNVDLEAFNNIIDSLLSAKRVYILGLRSSAPLASFLALYLKLILDNVILLNTTDASEIFEQIIKAREEDLVLSISFPRYSKRTIKASEFAKKQGAKVVAITDRSDSPLAVTAEHAILARSDMVSFVDSLVAPLSLINAIIVSVGMKRKEKLYKTFDTLEKIWDEYEIYEKNFNLNSRNEV